MFEDDDLKEIKERLFSEELVESLLEDLNCGNIHSKNGKIYAQLPDRFNSDRRNNIEIIDDDRLNGSIWTRKVSGDIFVIVGYILYETKDFEDFLENLYQVKHYICNLFEWDEYLSKYDTTFELKEEKKDVLSFLRPIQKERRKIRKVDPSKKENKTIDSSILNRYFNDAQYEFYKDGINIQTQKEFQVMYDRETERIVFPIHNRFGDMIGIKGRYIGKSQSIMKSSKYLYLKNCDKSIELFNLHRAEEHIKDKGEVIVFESEKSVMLAWQWGYKNSVAISGSKLSPVQAYLLKGLEVRIVFAFDKDVSKKELQPIKKMIRTRIPKAVYDYDDLLQEKMSPVDKGKDVWDNLYTNYKINI